MNGETIPDSAERSPDGSWSNSLMLNSQHSGNSHMTLFIHNSIAFRNDHS